MNNLPPADADERESRGAPRQAGDQRPPEREPSGESDAVRPTRSTARRVLGCLGASLLIFFVLVLLVFGACFMMLRW